ncbi:radical SAM protein [Elusimicrobiota bacterium]
MNLLHFGLKLLGGRLLGKRMPLQLNMHVTDVCNLRCKYCYVDFKHALEDMSLESIRRVITEARECGTERISLEGGEPLARKDIGDIVDIIRNLNIECNINTNGYFIPRRIESLRRVNVFSISIDGPPAVHDGLRGKGSYESALKGARVASENGIKLHFSSVLTRYNREHVGFMLDLAREYGAEWVPNSLFFMAGHRIDEAEAEYQIEDEDYKRLIQEIIDLKAAGAPIVWSNQTLRYVHDWPMTYFESNMFESAMDSDNGFNPLRCYAGRFFLVMQTNGDLYPCDPLLGYGEGHPPNALELGFREAMRRTTTHDCVACNSIVCSEYHNLFSMNVPVILNLLANYGGRAPRSSAPDTPTVRDPQEPPIVTVPK